jgi:hypothetical protein
MQLLVGSEISPTLYLEILTMTVDGKGWFLIPLERRRNRLTQGHTVRSWG